MLNSKYQHFWHVEAVSAGFSWLSKPEQPNLLLVRSHAKSFCFSICRQCFKQRTSPALLGFGKNYKKSFILPSCGAYALSKSTVFIVLVCWLLCFFVDLFYCYMVFMLFRLCLQLRELTTWGFCRVFALFLSTDSAWFSSPSL